MNVQRLLLFCFLSAALWDGNAGTTIFQRYSGDELKYSRSFTSNASVWFFCRRECQGSDVLIRTDQNKSVSGRYSIEYKKTPPKGGDVFGSISSLETSDSGRYRIGVGRSLVPDEFWDFELRVTGAEDPHNRINIYTEEEGRNIGILCWSSISSSTKFFCRNNCSNGQILLRTTRDEAQSGRYSIRYYQDPIRKTFIVNTKISQLKLSDSGLYLCGFGESLTSATFRKFNILVTAAPTTPATPTIPATPTTIPATPATPTIPATPTTIPATPATPTIPATPATPTIPATPTTIPATPATPTIPATPTTIPATPAIPTIPATPTTFPATPATPTTIPATPATTAILATTQSSGSPLFCPPPDTVSQFSVLLVVGGSVLIGGMLAIVVLLLYKLRRSIGKSGTWSLPPMRTSEEIPTTRV